MKLKKRIKQIVNLTLDDLYNAGCRTSESKESLKSWLVKKLMEDYDIEDCNIIEISLRALNMIDALDIVDFESMRRRFYL